MECKVIGEKRVFRDGQWHVITVYSAPEPPEQKAIVWPRLHGLNGRSTSPLPFDWYDDSKHGQDE